MDFLLRAKHWQICLAIIAGPLLVQLIIPIMLGAEPAWQADMSSGEVTSTPPDFGGFLADYSGLIGLSVALLLLSVLTQWCWMWAVGNRLHPRLPAGTQGLNLRTFQIAMILPWVFVIIIGLVSFNFVSSIIDTGPDFGNTGFDPSTFFAFFFSIMGLSLLLVAATVYLYYFLGKTIRSVELGQPARGSQYVGYSLLIYVLIIGVFVLQPKINAIVNGQVGVGDDFLV